MRTKDRQTGRSMLETLGYLAVVMVVAAGIGNLVANAFSDYKFSKASLQLSDLVSSIVKASAADDGYSDVVGRINKCISQTKSQKEKEEIDTKKPADARDCRLIPSTYRIAGGKLYHAFGGEVEISITTEGEGSTGTEDKLAISFAGLNKKQCVELAMKNWLNNKMVDLYSIVINRDEWYWTAYHEEGTKKTYSLPIKRGTVVGSGNADDGQCRNDIENMIMWVFN